MAKKKEKHFTEYMTGKMQMREALNGVDFKKVLKRQREQIDKNHGIKKLKNKDK